MLNVSLQLFAAQIFRKTAETVSAVERSRAKTVCLAVLYGQVTNAVVFRMH
jgi:DNA polymerase I-like protein with 3'-5' exonuclease and polymerase domains